MPEELIRPLVNAVPGIGGVLLALWLVWRDKGQLAAVYEAELIQVRRRLDRCEESRERLERELGDLRSRVRIVEHKNGMTE